MAVSIGDITKEFQAVLPGDTAGFEAFIKAYGEDERKGVVKLCDRAKKEIAAVEKEAARTEKMYRFEDKYRAEGFNYICGIDEVGRGPFAGPVVTCAVILPADERLLFLNDSKQVKKEKREELYEVIKEKAVAIGLGISSEETIDDINILQATYAAMRQSVEKLSVTPDILLIDAVKIPNVNIRQVPIIKGDTVSASIAAASIFAKVTRDRMMEEYDKVYPGYNFAGNAGYGTAEHIAAIKELGPCPIHRKTFIKKYVE